MSINTPTFCVNEDKFLFSVASILYTYTTYHQSYIISISLGSFQQRCNYCANAIDTHISTTVTEVHID